MDLKKFLSWNQVIVKRSIEMAKALVLLLNTSSKKLTPIILLRVSALLLPSLMLLVVSHPQVLKAEKLLHPMKKKIAQLLPKSNMKLIALNNVKIMW